MPLRTGRLALEEAGTKAFRRISRLVTRGSELGHSLQLANDPTIGAGGHEHDVVHDYALVMDSGVSVAYLRFILSGVVQLHDIAFGRVEHHLQPMALIQISLAQT